MWAIWLFSPAIERAESRVSSIGERVFLTCFGMVAVMALFGCLNLTFLIYKLKGKQEVVATTLKPGDSIPAFTANDVAGRSINILESNGDGWILNFISPNCPYCKEQLEILSAIEKDLTIGPYRLANISPAVSAELMQLLPLAEWIEDKNGSLRDRFHVSGYPTLFVVGIDGKIGQIISGVPDHLASTLMRQTGN
jgi:hypothetical protein